MSRFRPGQIVSIGKDNKCNIWNTKDGKKAAQLDFDPPQDGCKYMFKKCRSVQLIVFQGCSLFEQ